MISITITSVGKTKETWLDQAIHEYVKRLQPVASLDFHFFKDDKQLLKFLEKVETPIYLDAGGTQFDSVQFSSFIFNKTLAGTSKLTFVIGGPEGLPLALKGKPNTLSFSKMTYTHQMVRLILVEQIYRAFEIEKGSSYHK